jgi:cell wall assembly regulator SMI1
MTTKFQEILTFQKNNANEPIGNLNNPISNSDIEKIEQLLDEKLPIEIKELYTFANGQSNDGDGVLFGHGFCTSEEIIRQLEFNQPLPDPSTNFIANPEQSAKLIQKIVDFYISQAPKHKLFGLIKSWYKLEFSCSPNSRKGLDLYKNENTTKADKKIIPIDSEKENNVFETAKQIHHFEKPTYYWDELEFVVYADGKYEVNRHIFDYDNMFDFTSTPENAIKKKYFYHKWLPLFSDYGGNYIGIDLDPDKNGTKGQVINFGRDEQDMFVLAENLESFFDKMITEINKPENLFINHDSHLHDILIEQIKTKA